MKVYLVMVHFLEPREKNQFDYVNLVLKDEESAKATVETLNKIYLKENANKIAWIDVEEVY